MVLVFFHVQKGGRDKPSHRAFWETVGFGSLQTRGHRRRSRFQDSASASKREGSNLNHSVCLFIEETWAFCCLCLSWAFDQVTFGLEACCKLGCLGCSICSCHFMSSRLATWGFWACTVQLAGPFKLIDLKCSSSAPFLTSTRWHSLRSPVAVAFAELCWWPCACAAFGHFVLWWL